MLLLTLTLSVGNTAVVLATVLIVMVIVMVLVMVVTGRC